MNRIIIPILTTTLILSSCDGPPSGGKVKVFSDRFMAPAIAEGHYSQYGNTMSPNSPANVLGCGYDITESFLSTHGLRSRIIDMDRYTSLGAPTFRVHFFLTQALSVISSYIKMNMTIRQHTDLQFSWKASIIGTIFEKNLPGTKPLFLISDEYGDRLSNEKAENAEVIGYIYEESGPAQISFLYEISDGYHYAYTAEPQDKYSPEGTWRKTGKSIKIRSTI